MPAPLSLIAALLATAPDAVLAEPSEAYIIADVTVISAQFSGPLEHQDVLIEAGLITQMGPDLVVPHTIDRIDGSGLYLIPGLIDSHVHVYHATGLRRRYTEDYDELYAAYMEQTPLSYLYYGYTSLIETNSDAESSAQFSERSTRPRLFECGQGVILPDGFMALELPEGEVASLYPNFLHDRFGSGYLPDGASAEDHTPQAVVERIADAGGVCVKLYYEEALWWPDGDAPDFALPSLEILREVDEAAGARGLTILLHATTPRGHEIAMDAGIDALAHGLWEWPGVAYDAPGTPGGIATLLQREAASGIGIQPTLRTIRNTQSMFDAGFLDDPALKNVLPAVYIDYLRGDAQVQRDIFVEMFGPLLDPDADMDGLAALQLAFNERNERQTGDLDAAGARLLFGTDTAVGGFGWGNPPGLNGYLEMQAWARGGVGLRSLFEAATSRNADAFGLGDQIGRVAPGLRADLLLLRANPLETVFAYEAIELIILDGNLLDRQSLSARRD